MKAIFKKHQKEKVRVLRAAKLAHQAVLQAQHELVLLQAAGDGGPRVDGESDDEWLIAAEYENEEWEADE